ncbi:disulfide bond formation protein DsbA [Alteromonadaceae bacterium M269]|nr:disulfide bond formation protein DsbA [Alteromonadaceae bacterium M269]
MSNLRKNIMPYAARFLSSDWLLNTKRQIAEFKRSISGKTHELEVFIAASDPYSYLLVQVLPELVSRYKLGLRLRAVRDLQEDMFPDYPKWQANSLIDADRLASLYQLRSPLKSGVGTEHLPDITIATQLLLAIENEQDALAKTQQILSNYWSGILDENSEKQDSEQQLNTNQERLKALGHYYPAMTHYGGEWYWGIDRFDHLEKRLNELGVANGHPQVRYDLQTRNFCSPPVTSGGSDKPLEIFFSARSPYSYIGLLQAEKLAKHYDIPFVVKPVLPMMMRGMFVPDTKKMYIFHDTKREAKKLGLDYGFVADPLGEAVENCYSIYPYAKTQNKEVEFLLSFSRAVNSEGIRADQEQGLEIIVERCGLDWQQAKQCLGSQNWRDEVENNFAELQGLGLWGVPCFRYGDTVAWGQDRLWLIEQEVIGELGIEPQ